MKAFFGIAGITLIAAWANSFAATEFPGNLVPGDVARAFTSGTIYRGLPDNFPTPTLPAGTSLYVLGSMDNTFQQQLLLGTTLSGGELREILKTAYAALGWVDVSNFPNSLDLCHDTLGSMNFRMTTPSGAENRVMVNRTQRIPTPDQSMTCAEQLAYLNGGPATSPFLIFRESVPVLIMPTTTQNPIPPFAPGISSSSSSGGTFYQSSSQSRATIMDYSLVQLEEFIAQQMLAKGWSKDGSFVGSKSASAVWFKTVPLPPRPVTSTALVPTEMKLTAEISLLNLTTNNYSLSLRVSTGDLLIPTIGIRGIPQ